MPEIIGRQIELGLAVEAVRGTPQAVAETWIKKISAGIVERSEKKADESTRNVLEDSLNARIVKTWIEGDIEGNIHADAVGYFLYNLYGAVVSTLGNPGVYSHVFNIGQSIEHPSLTVFAKDGGVQQFAYSNAMLSSFELTASVDDYVKFTASVMGKDAVVNADTPSYATEYDFIGCDIVVKFADTEAGLVAATPIKPKDLTLTWDTGLITDHVLGSCPPDDIYNAKMQLEGEFNLNFDDTTFKDLYLGNTNKYMEVTITNPADIGSGDNPTITVLLNQVQIMDWNREDSTDDLVVQPVSFKAFYNEADGKQSQLTLQNNTVEYDTP